MVLHILACLLLTSGALLAEQQEMTVQNPDGTKVFLVTADDATIAYLQSQAPNSLTPQNHYSYFSIVPWKNGLDLYCNGEMVYGAAVSPYTGGSVASVTSQTPSEDDQVADIQEPVLRDTIRATLMTDTCDYGTNALKFVDDKTTPWIFLWNYGENRMHLKFDIVGNATAATIVIRVPQRAKLMEVVDEFRSGMESTARSLASVPWRWQDFRLAYVNNVLGIQDEREFTEVSKLQREAWAAVMKTTTSVYLQAMLMANTPATIIVGWSDVQEGNYWGLLDMLPVLPVLTKSVRFAASALKVAKVVVYEKRAIDVLRRAATIDRPRVSFSLADVALMRELKALAKDGPVSPKTLCDYLITKFPNGDWPEWACQICAGGTRCVSEDTLILMGRAYIRAGDIRVGQEIISRSDSSPDVVRKSLVSDIHRSICSSCVRIRFEGDKYEDIVSSPNHLLAIQDGGDIRWTEASEIRPGDRLATLTGVPVHVRSVESLLGQPVRLVEITAEGDHTFFIGHGCIWTHNACILEMLNEIGGSISGGMRTILATDLKMRTYWPAVSYAYKNAKTAEEAAVLVDTLRRAVYAVKPGNHEWILRANMELILRESRTLGVQEKLLTMMDRYRTPVKDIWFNNVGQPKGFLKIEDGSLAKCGHTTNAALNITQKGYSTAFHADVEKVFVNALKRDQGGLVVGFDAIRWHDDMVNAVLQKYFKGSEYDKRLAEIESFAADAKNLWP